MENEQQERQEQHEVSHIINGRNSSNIPAVIAKLCGWQMVPADDGPLQYWQRPDGSLTIELPDYRNDLSAIQQAIATRTKAEREEIARKLVVKCDARYDGHFIDCDFAERMVNASAPQRFQAFCQVVKCTCGKTLWECCRLDDPGPIVSDTFAATAEEMREAILEHCRTSREQLRSLDIDQQCTRLHKLGVKSGFICGVETEAEALAAAEKAADLLEKQAAADALYAADQIIGPTGLKFDSTKTNPGGSLI